MYLSEVKFLALVILLVLIFATAASSGRVTTISERSSGINPAATKGFRGEYLGGDVTEVAVTRYVTPGDGDDTATDAGGDVTNEDGGETIPENVVEGKNTPEDVAGDTEDVAGGTGDVAEDTEDVAGGSENVAGGTEDVAGGTEDVVGDNITPTHAIADDICEDETTAEDTTAGKVTGGDKIPTTESEIDGIEGSQAYYYYLATVNKIENMTLN